MKVVTYKGDWLRFACAIIGHSWKFIVSFPTLERGEIYCGVCGRTKIDKPKSTKELLK